MLPPSVTQEEDSESQKGQHLLIEVAAEAELSFPLSPSI